MRPRDQHPRPGRRHVVLLAVVAAIAGTVLSACGGDSTGYSEGTGDAGRGRELFISNCGGCHTLAEAGTTGQVGPNLDDAFAQSRKDGLGESTIVQVVKGQIFYPVVQTPTGAPGMPGIDQTLPLCEEGQEPSPGCVDDQDQAAEDIATYVAGVAGTGAVAPAGGAATGGDTSGGDTTGGDTSGGDTSGGDALAAGKQVFTANCGSCHTLADAQASGAVGPNLDETKPPKELVVDRVTNGKGTMPAFGDQLSAEQIDAVAEYVSSVSGS